MSRPVRVKLRVEVDGQTIEYEGRVNDPEMASWRDTPMEVPVRELRRMFLTATNFLLLDAERGER